MLTRRCAGVNAWMELLMIAALMVLTQGQSSILFVNPQDETCKCQRVCRVD